MTEKDYKYERATLEVSIQQTKVEEARKNLEQGIRKLQSDLEQGVCKLQSELKREELRLEVDKRWAAFCLAEKERGFEA